MKGISLCRVCRVFPVRPGLSRRMYMLKTRVFPIVVLSLLAVILSSCASSLNSVWKKEDFRGPGYKKVLVIAMAEIELNRIFFENTFKEQFAKRGVTSVSSYTAIPQMGKLDRKIVEQTAKELGVDAVIVSKIDRIGRYEANLKAAKTGDLRYYELRSIYGESAYDDVIPFWPSGFFTPADTRVFVLDTSLYDASEGRLIWTAHSKIEFTERPYSEIEAFVRNIVSRMADDRII